jgi:hypothetical protein
MAGEDRQGREARSATSRLLFACRMRTRSACASAILVAPSRRSALASGPAIASVRLMIRRSEARSLPTGSVRPWRRALRAARALPATVRGPVLRRALRRLAARLRALARPRRRLVRGEATGSLRPTCSPYYFTHKICTIGENNRSLVERAQGVAVLYFSEVEFDSFSRRPREQLPLHCAVWRRPARCRASPELRWSRAASGLRRGPLFRPVPGMPGT